MKAFIERVDSFFRISSRHTTAGREVLGGVTTFAAMSYIVVVNPMILSAAGMSREGILIATVLSAIFGTLAMALWANLPVALAPGMGSNIVFAQVVVLQMGLRWQTALAMVFLNAVVFLILSLTRWRRRSSLPSLRRSSWACSAPSASSLRFLGLKNSGLVIGNSRFVRRHGKD